MDNAARWPELQPPPPQDQHPLPPPYNPYAAPPPQPHHLNLLHHPQSSLPSSSSYYANLNPYPTQVNPNPPPPPAGPLYMSDHYAPHGGYSAGPSAGAGVTGSRSGYYYNSIGREPHEFGMKEATWGFDAVGYGCGQVPPRPSNGLDLAAAAPYGARPQWGTNSNYRGGGTKNLKLSKIVQPAHCPVCKIDCDTKEMMDIHKQGKKHKKNLQKLQDSITPKHQRAQGTPTAMEKKEASVPAPAPAAPALPAVPAPAPAAPALPAAPAPAPASGVKAKRKGAVEEDLETKKRKMLEGGAEPSEVKVCIVCNVVVNSEKVYASHLAGSKHAAMLKKQQEAAAN